MIVPCPPPNSCGRIKHVRECIALAPVFQPLFCQVVAEEVVLVANLLEDSNLKKAKREESDLLSDELKKGLQIVQHAHAKHFLF